MRAATNRVLPTGGVALEWDSSPEPSLDTFLGYRLCRADTLPQAPCSAIGPWPNPGTAYTDPAGTPGSVYRLWASLADYTEVLLGDVTVASGILADESAELLREFFRARRTGTA